MQALYFNIITTPCNKPSILQKRWNFNVYYNIKFVYFDIDRRESTYEFKILTFENKCVNETIHQKNTRNAGRKKKLSASEIRNIKEQLSKGMTVESIENMYKTSRQIITKSINSECDRQFPMQICICTAIK